MARTSAECDSDLYRQMLFEIIESYDDLAYEACKHGSEMVKQLESLRRRVKFKTVIDVMATRTKRLEEVC